MMAHAHKNPAKVENIALQKAFLQFCAYLQLLSKPHRYITDLVAKPGYTIAPMGFSAILGCKGGLVATGVWLQRGAYCNRGLFTIKV